MESVQHVSKIQYVYLLKKYKKLNVWREAVGPSFIKDARLLQSFLVRNMKSTVCRCESLVTLLVTKM
jgi:hypothetical protein